MRYRSTRRRTYRVRTTQPTQPKPSRPTDQPRIPSLHDPDWCERLRHFFDMPRHIKPRYKLLTSRSAFLPKKSPWRKLEVQS